MPQYLPLACWQLCGVQVPGVAPHTLGMPAPHVSPAPQPPQSIRPPQPSPTMPQYLPYIWLHDRRVHPPASGAKPQRFAMPSPPQLCPFGQPPQSIWPPQPSPTMPQYWPFAWLQLVTVQSPESRAAPHTFGTPLPPQVKPPGQPPQSILPPQP